MRVLHALGFGAALIFASAHVPYGWTHRLTEHCIWRERSPLAAFGRGTPDDTSRHAEARCWASRGAHDPNRLPVLNEVVKTWPDAVQLAAWNRRDDVEASDDLAILAWALIGAVGSPLVYVGIKRLIK